MYNLMRVPFHVTGAEPGADSMSPEFLMINWLQEMRRKQHGLKLSTRQARGLTAKHGMLSTVFPKAACSYAFGLKMQSDSTDK